MNVDQDQDPSQPVDQDVSPEQQLEAEVAELRYVFLTDFVRSIHCTLKVAEVDLIAAKSHRDQFQETSQANEATLVALNATVDEYKESSELRTPSNDLLHAF